MVMEHIEEGNKTEGAVHNPFEDIDMSVLKGRKPSVSKTETDAATAVIGIAQSAQDQVATALHHLVRLGVAFGLVVVLILSVGLTANIVALTQFHSTQQHNHSTLVNINNTVTSHNVLLTETLGVACKLIQGDPAITIPAQCIPLLKAASK